MVLELLGVHLVVVVVVVVVSGEDPVMRRRDDVFDVSRNGGNDSSERAQKVSRLSGVAVRPLGLSLKCKITFGVRRLADERACTEICLLRASVRSLRALGLRLAANTISTKSCR